MVVIIGSARIDENGNITGGKAGDQTGKEVCTQSYYMHSKGWYLLRAKDAKIAVKIAKAMLDACNNKYIGYDQGQRNTIDDMLQKYKTLAGIKEPCECDCSKLVSKCVKQASGKDPGNFNTSAAVSCLSKTGLFEAPTEVNSKTILCTGDILCTKTKGHIVIVTSGNPRPVTGNELKVPTKQIMTTTCRLRLRKKAGTDAEIIKVLAEGTECEVVQKGFKANGYEWYEVKTKTATGYVACEYLKKK